MSRDEFVSKWLVVGTESKTDGAKALWSRGLRYRKHPQLPGKPDIVFPGKRIAIFVDGCFWHGCPKHGSIPRTNTKFWATKILRTAERDQENNLALEKLNWKVLRFWEHELKTSLVEVADLVEREWKSRLQ